MACRSDQCRAEVLGVAGSPHYGRFLRRFGARGFDQVRQNRHSRSIQAGSANLVSTQVPRRGPRGRSRRPGGDRGASQAARMASTSAARGRQVDQEIVVRPALAVGGLAAGQGGVPRDQVRAGNRRGSWRGPGSGCGAAAGRCPRTCGGRGSGRPSPSTSTAGPCARIAAAIRPRTNGCAMSTAPRPGAASAGRTTVTFSVPGPTTTVPPPLDRRAIGDAVGPAGLDPDVVAQPARGPQDHRRRRRAPRAAGPARPRARRPRPAAPRRARGWPRSPARSGPGIASIPPTRSAASTPAAARRLSPDVLRYHVRLATPATSPLPDGEFPIGRRSRCPRRSPNCTSTTSSMAQRQLFKLLGAAFRLETPRRPAARLLEAEGVQAPRGHPRLRRRGADGRAPPTSRPTGSSTSAPPTR